MTAEELKKVIDGGEEVLLLDVCEAAECADGPVVEGAENVPMGEMFIRAAQDKLPKDKKMVAICKSGYRCQIVADELRKKGYDIHHLEGGAAAWNDLNE